MAYRVETGSRRFVGSGGVIVVHVALAYLLVFGLKGPDILPPLDPPFAGEQIPLPPIEPPPPEKREEAKQDLPIETPVHNPDSPIDIPVREEVRYEPTVSDPGPPVLIPQPPYEPGPPIDIGQFTPKLARPINQVLRWVTTDDYPPGSIRRGEQGSARFSLEIDARGRVTDCAITRSSGHPALDAATCRYVTSRARFEPATDRNGDKVAGTYSNSVNWKLPE